MSDSTIKRVKTRKPHRCWGCATKYPPGTHMDVVVCFDETPSRAYWCDVCYEYSKRHLEYGDVVGFGEIKANDEETWNEIKSELEQEAHP